ncbi:MAG TPA: sulfatase-like hydrolase/transferase [Thermoanaerobaculia bacterium]|jgi:arylsulfatase A-like enzyme/Tfp pilus assembly protein PilF|nr:sulfatase-like hydrolase/transferase [Thermoanaerobaculia bacterium]
MGAPTALKRAARTWIVPALILTGLGAAFAAPPKPAPNPQSTPRRSLVLITLDTTRADHLGSYGWKFARTPNLDALAARGTRFVRCDTAAPVTLPSHATILTGLYPPRTGVRDNGTFVLADKVETLAERLAAHGYDTAAAVSAIVLARRHGLNQGFRVYDDDLGVGFSAGTEVAERQAEPTTASALAIAAKLKPPFFLWVHYYDPHEEYRPPTRIAAAMGGPTRLYDAEIAAVDEQIGVLLSKLPKDVAVAVVGDHGEMMGEHGELHHGLLLYRAARRVPLILAGPGVPSGRRQECLVRTADVAPTLLALAGVPLPQGLDGASLLPLAKTCDRTSYSESFLPFFAYKWYPLRSLSTDRFFYLHAPKSSLYQIPSDPEEKTDLGAEQPAALGLWEKKLRDQLLKTAGETLDAEMRSENVLTEEQRRQLASLGYLGGAGGGSGGAVRRDLPDPRNMAGIADALHDAAADIQKGKCKESLPKLQEIVKKDPHNFPALTLAGNCLEEAGRWDSALALFQRASKENELSAVPVANIAGCLKELGRKAEAEKEYRRALALDPSQGEASSNLAQLLDDRGERAEALKVLDASVAAGSYSSEIHLERGLILAEMNRFEDAMRDFREAARRNPVNPVPLENAARVAYRLGRHRESVQFYEQLLRIQPNRADLWKTAGALYFYELNDKTDAERCFRRALALETDPAERDRIEQALDEITAAS